jgi:sodium/proline symporter
MWILSVFVIYLVVLAVIGIYCMRFNRTLADFVLGGRKMGVWVTAISAQASDMSAWLLVGLPAAAYETGLSSIWIAIGCAVGIIFNWVVIAPRLRRESEACGALTIPDYLAARYGGGRVQFVRIIAVVVILLAYATYIASQFIAAGKVFEVTFSHVETPWGVLSISYHWGMLIGVGIIMLYTVMGGFLAVSWTDLAQGMLMVLTVVILPIVGLIALGSLAVLGAKLRAFDPNILGVAGKMEGGSLISADGVGFWIGVVLGSLSWGLGYPGQPHILVRFMALKDPRKMRQAAIIGIAWSILAMAGAIFLGLVARATLGQLSDKDHVMPSLALKLMHPGIAGLMIAGAIAAMMSTVDSQLLVAASAVEQDIYIRMLGGKVRGRRAVWIGRITILLLGGAALPLAWGGESVLQKVFDAWRLLGAGLGPVIAMGLLTKRANRHGAVAGMLSGAGIVYFWTAIAPIIHAEKLFTTGLIPGFVVNLVLIWTVSLATDRPGDQPSSAGGV